MMLEAVRVVTALVVVVQVVVVAMTTNIFAFRSTIASLEVTVISKFTRIDNAKVGALRRRRGSDSMRTNILIDHRAAEPTFSTNLLHLR